jgi:hypothetical protein
MAWPMRRKRAVEGRRNVAPNDPLMHVVAVFATVTQRTRVHAAAAAAHSAVTACQ